ncbi:hypothetical protein [Bordetella genomosp. 4]|uniref:Uncharacterized protein n=1 Tax=Bordetella genomosp. 4 TaxID=463044 RepID=A0A261UEH2_9BORD|nr:hypothetical protein [Bordetella genomosp. 4]OZI59253.1 hypothetical protein CAL20_06460 [Bordetella genomosp. 4]
MVGKLLSTTFSPDSLNDAVVEQTSTDINAGTETTTGFRTESTVSAWGFWGWLGYRVHTASTLGQQQKLFDQLKSELREEYLGGEPIDARTENGAHQLNSEISSVEKKGLFRGTDQSCVSMGVVRLAAIKRIEAEIDLLSSRKGAFLTPRMIAELRTKAEIQFASITMSGVRRYRPQSTGGRLSDAQNFDPLKDYKALLRRSQAGSDVIRLTTNSDMSSQGNQDAVEVGRGAARLMLAPRGSVPPEENVAERTLAHCLASLKLAYFRGARVDSVSTKEVAFDRLVGKYVESRLIDKKTGRLCDLTKNDFQALERLAFKNRSTVGRAERPFNEMFEASAAGPAHSRYSGFTLEKDAGVIHLIAESPRHAAMYIETLDPETHKWKLTKLDFAYVTDMSRPDPSLFEQLTDESLLRGTIRLSEAEVTKSMNGGEAEYKMTNPTVISEADRKIGRSVPTGLLGMGSGKMKDVTSIRLPITEIKKIIETAKVLRKREIAEELDDVPLYHLYGRTASKEELGKELKIHQHRQASAMVELVRIQMLFDHLAEMKLDDKEAAAAQAAAAAAAQGAAPAQAAAPAPERPWCPTLLQSLRDQGLLAKLSLESLQRPPRNTPMHEVLGTMKERIGTVEEAYVDTSEAAKKRADLVRSVTDASSRFGASVKGLLEDGKGLSASERGQLQKLFPSEVNGLLAELWYCQRAIHQLSYKIEKLSNIEALELDLKAVRKELQMREASKTIAKEHRQNANVHLAAAMRKLKPDNWDATPSSEELESSKKDGSFEAFYEQFVKDAIATQQKRLALSDSLRVDSIMARIREKAARQPKSEPESLSDALTIRDFEPLASRLSELKPAGWDESWTADRLRDIFLTKPKRLSNYIENLAAAPMSEEDNNRLAAAAKRIVHDTLSTPFAVRAKNPNEDLAQIRVKNFGGELPEFDVLMSDEDLAKLAADLESRYSVRSAEMIKGADGYTATDEKGRRALRAGNCADWVRSMMQLAGVNIEGIKLVSTSSIIPDRYNFSDPQVLARGRYDSFRIGFARTGFKLHEKTPLSVRNVSPQPRTALQNQDEFLMQRRRHGVQYDLSGLMRP